MGFGGVSLLVLFPSLSRAPRRDVRSWGRRVAAERNRSRATPRTTLLARNRTRALASSAFPVAPLLALRYLLPLKKVHLTDEWKVTKPAVVRDEWQASAESGFPADLSSPGAHKQGCP